MLKREWDAENKGSYHIPGNTVTLVPEFAVEDLLMGINVGLVPEFAVKDLPLGRAL